MRYFLDGWLMTLTVGRNCFPRSPRFSAIMAQLDVTALHLAQHMRSDRFPVKICTTQQNHAGLTDT